MKSKNFDKLIFLITGFALIFTLILMKNPLNIQSANRYNKYQSKLFDNSKVHTIDLFIDDKDEFFENAEDENYVSSTIVIDGEKFTNIGLRTKGNNSLRLTKKYGHDRYSLKLEFDQFEEKSYYGLDKFSLDSSFQDNAYLKTFLAFDMMNFMGVKTPLTSYTWVRINGEDWGLFLAIEEIEEGFARRNYGLNHGQIYKSAYKSLSHDNYDIKLIYTDDKFESYDNLFSNSKFNPTDEEKKKVINAIKILSTGENLESVIDIEAVLRYFVVQVFVVNLDSYLGNTSHNYFLYEEDGKISMLPWDYNLAFSTYSLGMPNPINDSNLYVNYPIDTPNTGEIMLNRPLYHNIMKNPEYFNRYRELFDYFIREYFESGRFEQVITETENLIEEYVKEDPTAFINFEDHKLGVKTIKEFINLRAQSIRGQLNGEIPSTIKGQNQNSEDLIDASHIKLEDMGEVEDLKDGIK